MLYNNIIIELDLKKFKLLKHQDRIRVGDEIAIDIK